MNTDLILTGQLRTVDLACKAGKIFLCERSHGKKLSRHLEFFMQWKTRERKKGLLMGRMIGKRKNRGGGGAKNILPA